MASAMNRPPISDSVRTIRGRTPDRRPALLGHLKRFQKRCSRDLGYELKSARRVSSRCDKTSPCSAGDFEKDFKSARSIAPLYAALLVAARQVQPLRLQF